MQCSAVTYTSVVCCGVVCYVTPSEDCPTLRHTLVYRYDRVCEDCLTAALLVLSLSLSRLKERISQFQFNLIELKLKITDFFCYLSCLKYELLLSNKKGRREKKKGRRTQDRNKREEDRVEEEEKTRPTMPSPPPPSSPIPLTLLHCTAQYCTALHNIALHCTVLCCAILCSAVQ